MDSASIQQANFVLSNSKCNFVAKLVKLFQQAKQASAFFSLFIPSTKGADVKQHASL